MYVYASTYMHLKFSSHVEDQSIFSFLFLKFHSPEIESTLWFFSEERKNINMGSCLSSSNKAQTAPNNVRIVHLNGLVEDFDHPVFVNQLITSKPPKHFICTPAQLLSPFSKPLTPNTMLEPGRLYFLLPFSTLQPDVSPVNLATLVKKLTEKANSRRPDSKVPSASPGASPMRSPARSFGLNVSMGSPGRSPTRFYEPEIGSMGYRSQRSVQAWRPFLDTIRERSFNRRSESDLQKDPEKQN